MTHDSDTGTSREMTHTPAPVISVVMAAYNAASSLPRAIESLQAQTFTDWELIIVDDGSSDGTADILARYARNDRRIRPVSQANAGVSAARRRGVGLASGEYVIHFDADDYAEPAMLAEMLAEGRRNGADITIAGFVVDHACGVKETVPQTFGNLDRRGLVGALLDGRMHGALWNKLIRRDAYVSFGADFSEGLSFGEDMVTVMKMIDRGASVKFMPGAWYHYCYNNPQSLTNNPSARSFTRRKEWIAACEPYARPEFGIIIEGKRFNANFFALIHGLCDRKEFYAYGHPSRRYMKYLVGNRKYQPGMWLASIGLFGAGRLWCRLIGWLTR